MKKRILIFFLFCGFLAKSQLLTFKNINHENGLSLSSVLSLTQDKYGYIWIGTDGFGLQRYDGKVVKTVNLDLTNNEHHVTYIDPVDNGIYFSSKFGGFYQFLNNELKEILPDQSDFGDRFAIKKIGNTLFLMGSKKMKLYRGGKIIKEVLLSPKFNNIVQILEVPQGVILITNNRTYYITESKILELSKWINKEINPIACRYFDNKIEFFELNKADKTVVNLGKSGEFKSLENKKLIARFNFPFYKVFSKDKQLFALSPTNEIYSLRNNLLKYIPKNTSKTNFKFSYLFIDQNYDYWASSSNSGLFKISDEPFTKIELENTYQNQLIRFIYRNNSNDLFLSTFDEETYISSYNSKNFVKYDLTIYGKTLFKGKEIFATNRGIERFNKGVFSPLNGIRINKKTVFVYAHKEKLYYSTEDDGLFQFNSETGKTIQILKPDQASHVYTAQIDFNQNKIYFGTNNGIYMFSTVNLAAKAVNVNFKVKGSYAGVSCVDSYGTIWFSYDKKLVGITKREEYLVIDNKKFFKSTLFYSLNADPYGNLIIGTNIGITKLKIDHLGNVINYFEYNSNNGFNGFETHMRSTFQDGKIIYVGTIEGIFSINTEKLEYFPNPPMPIIFQQKEKRNNSFNSDEDLIKLNYMALNPKLMGIQFTYRLKGKSNYWSELSPKTEAYFSNLSDQEYIFQVRSTYDGLTFSPIASYKIVKNTPFWKTKWFILFLILSIALANIIVLDRSKSFELSQVVENQDIEITSKIRSIILAFGLVANTGAHYFASLVEELPNFLVLNVFVAFILTLLFLLSIFKHPFMKLNTHLLKIGLFVIIGQCFLSAYISAIHPLYVVIISLVTAITPFILNRISEVIMFSVLQLISVVAIVFLVDKSIYNEILFLIAIIVSICLSIFITYIRNESLQKLIFISEIINKGKVIAIAFDKTNRITYISENSASSLNINPLAFLGKSISELNQFVFHSLSKRKIDLTHEFKDEENHIIPMKLQDGSEIWMEWSCRIFSKKSKVIFGQDISERIKIKNSYETLIKGSKDLIYFLDVNGIFLEGNEQFYEILGYEKNELLGRDAIFLIKEENQVSVRSFFKNQFKCKTPITYFETKICTKDGTEIWVGQHTTILFEMGSEKMVKGFLCLARDIRDKKRQEEIIELQQEKIVAEIKYVKEIQANLIVNRVQISDCFDEFELFFQAKEAISGDFYWFDKIQEKQFFVLLDCPGHDIPSAFMTFLAVNSLNELIVENKIFDPSKILQLLDEKLLQTLPKNSSNDTKRGMKVSILIYDKKKKIYHYACAGGKFILQKNGEFNMYQGESKCIGEQAEGNFTQYNTYSLDEKQIDAFYFFTAGIQEQMSESTQNKFSLKRLLDVMKKQQDVSIAQMVKEVKSKHQKWRGKAEQTDDICFVGFRFKA